MSRVGRRQIEMHFQFLYFQYDIEWGNNGTSSGIVFGSPKVDNWGGSPHQKLKKNKFVLKWFLGNFKGFKLIFLKKKKTKKEKIGPLLTHPPTLGKGSKKISGIFH